MVNGMGSGKILRIGGIWAATYRQIRGAKNLYTTATPKAISADKHR